MTPDELAGLREDRAAANRFERRFTARLILPIAFGLAGFAACAHFADQRTEDASGQNGLWIAGGVGFLVVGIAWLLVGLRQMQRSVPEPKGAGKGYQVYRLESRGPDWKYELVYVCHADRTYFRRLYEFNERE